MMPSRPTLAPACNAGQAGAHVASCSLALHAQLKWLLSALTAFHADPCHLLPTSSVTGLQHAPTALNRWGFFLGLNSARVPLASTMRRLTSCGGAVGMRWWS